MSEYCINVGFISTVKKKLLHYNKNIDAETVVNGGGDRINLGSLMYTTP